MKVRNFRRHGRLVRAASGREAALREREPRPTRHQFRPCAALYLGVAVLGLSACSDTPERGVVTPAISAAKLRSVLTGAALAQIDASGKFLLPQPSGAGPYPELTADQATVFARAWVREFAALRSTTLSRQHGGPVDVRNLTPCGRPLYARASFNAPPSTIPIAVRRMFGPWWFVTFCGAGEPQVSVGVAGWATDLTVANGASGSLQFPSNSGNEFFVLGVPTGHTGEYPASPEAAAALAADQSSRRVMAVPELVMASPDEGLPQNAHWLVQLESPAQLRVTHSGVVTLGQIAVTMYHPGRAGVAAFTAMPTQPATTFVDWPTPPNPGEAMNTYLARRRIESATVVRRSDTPVRFERLASAPGS